MGAPFKSLAVANKFIELAYESGDNITLMKLLKLVYFAHGWHLALADRPLVDDTIEAWKFGPVAPSIYRTFKDNGSNPIERPGQDLDLENLTFSFPVLPKDQFLNGFMEKMWEVYGRFTPYQLSALTHQQGTPWFKVWFEQGGSQRKGADIPDELIKEYFKGRLTKVETGEATIR